MITVHVARVAQFTVDSNNNRIDKNSINTTISQLCNTRMEYLILPDDDYVNTSGYPTVEEYLNMEHADGFLLKHLDQSYLITYKVS